ncbi:AraC family transcriptional regulator [Amycolatopsis jiangsuensis]|uniref:AraC family transcriptional activator of mtrCDE n=1 Tax=Amycolatopsis jiangsuensis TaxID=1181879 RepID=A0A840IRX3_9PSEU|nr:AraC family transcriptional regulator [Amycolatopsis jiangsuensis]MBB4683972.1 AraC family transcriptional activator of mtrCDE [Amycolatopsis jiangsuensis]
MAQLEARLERRCLLGVLGVGTRMDAARRAPFEAPFHVLLEGECRLQAGSTLLHLRAGDMVLLPSGAPHRIFTVGPGEPRGTTETPGEVLIRTLSEPGAGDPVIDLFCGHYVFGTGAGRLLFRSLPDPVHVSFGQVAESDEVLRMLSVLLRREAEREGEGTAAILASLCTVLLAMVLRTSRGAATTATLWTAATDGRISRAVEGILRDPAAGWSIERLSCEAAMSRASFLRHFTDETGATVGAFLARVRLMAAAELLTSTEETVARVAARSGYQSESAFSRAFRAAFETTPARFRREQARARRPESLPANPPQR